MQFRTEKGVSVFRIDPDLISLFRIDPDLILLVRIDPDLIRGPQKLSRQPSFADRLSTTSAVWKPTATAS